MGVPASNPGRGGGSGSFGDHTAPSASSSALPASALLLLLLLLPPTRALGIMVVERWYHRCTIALVAVAFMATGSAVCVVIESHTPSSRRLRHTSARPTLGSIPNASVATFASLGFSATRWPSASPVGAAAADCRVCFNLGKTVLPPSARGSVDKYTSTVATRSENPQSTCRWYPAPGLYVVRSHFPPWWSAMPLW